MKPYITIGLTQYNELKNLKKGVIDDVIKYLQKQKYTWEIVINDDGSTDGSKEYTRKYANIPNVKYIESDHKGKAGGLNIAINNSNGEWILLTDIDQSTPLSEIEKLLPFTNEYQAVIGSRGNYRGKATIIRKLAGFIFGNFRKLLILHNIEDTQCGFKLFKTEQLKKVFPKLGVVKDYKASGWNVTAYDVEILFLYQKLGNKIKEVPVVWENEDISNTKQRKFVKESLDMLKQIFTVVIKDKRGEYSDTYLTK